MAVTYVDAEGALQAWVNAQSDLVGEGNPLPKGALLNRMRGATPLCYVLLHQAGGHPTGPAEAPDLEARVAGQVFGPSKEAAARAAAAYADVVLNRLTGTQVVLSENRGRLLVVSGVSGPTWAPDRDEPRYLVDVELILRPT